MFGLQAHFLIDTVYRDALQDFVHVLATCVVARDDILFPLNHIFLLRSGSVRKLLPQLLQCFVRNVPSDKISFLGSG